MSHALYRFGRFAARRPWVVIGTWLLVRCSSSPPRGRSDAGSVILSRCRASIRRTPPICWRAPIDRAGLTAQVVVTPLHDGVSFFDSREAQEDLAQVEARVAALDHVLGVTKPTEEIAAEWRVGGGWRFGVAGRSHRADPRAVPGDRGTRRGRSREPQGARGKRCGRRRRCRSRWVGISSSRSRRPRPARAR